MVLVEPNSASLGDRGDDCQADDRVAGCRARMGAREPKSDAARAPSSTPWYASIAVRAFIARVLAVAA